LYLLINYFGIKWLVRLNNPITVLKIATPVLLIIALLFSHFDSNNFHLATGPIYTLASVPAAILGAGLVYSFNGFQIVLSYAGEIENPKRNLGLSMILAIVLTACLFTVLQFAFMASIPNGMLASSGWSGINFSSPFVQLTLLLGLNLMSMLLVADSIVSPSATGYVYLGATSRMLFSMTKEKQLPFGSFMKLHPKYNLCRTALITCFIIATAFLWLSDSWSSLMLIVTAYNVIGYLSAPISMGAIAPKKRILGLFVFLLITTLLHTLEQKTILPAAISLTALMALYLFCQSHLSVKQSLYFSLPFMVYLWTLYFKPHEIVLFIVSAIVYMLITSKTFIARSKASRNSNELEELTTT
jgi:amino acid transporter